MKTIAIDFETANEERRSACAIGLAWIENGGVTRRERRLIRPKDMRFSHHNILVHGIRPEDVRDKPEFPAVMSEFLPDINGALILAHNANFDIEVMCATLNEYRQIFPEFRFVCTMAMSRLLWPTLLSSSLDAVAEHFGIAFQHHNPEEDAFACASIALVATKELGVSDIPQVLAKISLTPGSVQTDGYFPCAIHSRPTKEKKFIKMLAASKTDHLESILNFVVKGSTGNLYEITARRVEGRLRMTCTCQAGQNGLWCKHRTALLNGEFDHLSSGNLNDMATLAEIASGAVVERRDTSFRRSNGEI